MSNYQSPAHLQDKHNLEQFDCGISSLNNWLIRIAKRNEKTGGSRTYVVCDKDNHVVAYYCLANGAVIHSDAPKKLTRNMPDPIPVMVIGRLAVDINHQKQGLGPGLLRDAVIRVLQAGEIGGIRAILVHAISERAKSFYENNGFLQCPFDNMMLMLPLKPIIKH